MARFKNGRQIFDKWLWGLSIVFGMLVPVLTDRLPFLTRVRWVEVVLLLINGIYSIWLGRYIARKQLTGWLLLVFPILFLIAAYFFMPHYTYYLAPAYWAVSYLAYSMRQQ
ncbi:hypothetical protein [Limosilactobacillus sp.]|jgi:hypothetical protein|uniref:hypothetical protein n=1 Tax=Limosilactobacillus sp. TaxID=2773925 RepID=UPI00359FE88D